MQHLSPQQLPSGAMLTWLTAASTAATATVAWGDASTQVSEGPSPGRRCKVATVHRVRMRFLHTERVPAIPLPAAASPTSVGRQYPLSDVYLSTCWNLSTLFTYRFDPPAVKKAINPTNVFIRKLMRSSRVRHILDGFGGCFRRLLSAVATLSVLLVFLYHLQYGHYYTVIGNVIILSSHLLRRRIKTCGSLSPSNIDGSKWSTQHFR